MPKLKKNSAEEESRQLAAKSAAWIASAVNKQKNEDADVDNKDNSVSADEANKPVSHNVNISISSDKNNSLGKYDLEMRRDKDGNTHITLPANCNFEDFKKDLKKALEDTVNQLGGGKVTEVENTKNSCVFVVTLDNQENMSKFDDTLTGNLRNMGYNVIDKTNDAQLDSGPTHSAGI